MLVMTRKKQETIVIDGVVKVTILEIHGGRIRLGIEAPKEIPVLRSEISPAQPDTACSAA